MQFVRHAVTRIGWRWTLLGLSTAALLAALAVGTPAALLVATGRACACAQPPDVVVANADAHPVTVSWALDEPAIRLPGEATSGSQAVHACDSAWVLLPEGRVHVTLTSGSAVQRFDLEIPHQFASQPFATRVVRLGGAIEETSLSDGGDDPLSACRLPSPLTN